MHSVTFVPSSDQLVFYPIGNTPAVNFLCHQSPNPTEDTTTEVLALACGDPRSILYSLWSEGKPERHKVNFTCCDLEPAVLARNVLLFSLMIDCADLYPTARGIRDPKLSAIWNLCYHFYVPIQDVELLQEQATKLLGYSKTIESWAQSPYSAIKFLSLQTIDELRNIWSKYAFKRAPTAQTMYEAARRSEVRATYDNTYGTGGESMTFYAGPHFEKGLDTMNASLRKYWKTGVVAGNAADVKALGWSFVGSGVVNPMMMISLASEQFVVHFTSDPLTGFHLASVFDGKRDEATDIEAMVTTAKTQFIQWSKAFVDHASSDSVSVNIYYGDAVTLCHELAARNSSTGCNDGITRVYTTQWSAKPFLLNGNAVLPAYFDVIDTSNLADWIGLHNLLPPVVQILAPRNTSVLYTETLRLSSVEPELDLCEALFMDVDLACLMIGVAPMGHMVGYSTENSHGENLIHLENPRRYRMRIPWRVPFERYPSQIRPHKVKFEMEELCEIFFGIYMKMFDQEALKRALLMTRMPGYKPKPMQTFNRYTRLSLATFIKHTMRNIQTDWVHLLPTLLKKIEEDKSLDIGRDTLLDFVTHLHINGALKDGPKLLADCKPTLKELYRCITLVVPRKRLQIFRKHGGAPGIHLSIMRGDKEYRMFSIDCFFGTLKQNEDGSPGEVIEDPLGWAGRSKLIVTCPVSTTLLDDGVLWDCALKITPAMNSIPYLVTGGGDVAVYKAPSADKKHVIISDHPPGTSSVVITPFVENNLANELDPLTIDSEHTVVISASMVKTSLMLQAKLMIGNDSAEATALQNAAFVTLAEITPCSIVLKIGDKFSRRLLFPYPVDGHKASTRIARKSLWIEVNVPVASAKVPGAYDSDPFPVVLEEGSQPYAWTLPRVDLSKQPAISSKDTKEWIWDVNDQLLSAREKNIVNKTIVPTDFRSTLPYFKKTVHQLVLDSCSPPEIPILMLVGKEKDREIVCDTLIIANCLRHGRETSGLILDAWLIPMKAEGSLEFAASLPRKPGKAKVFQLRKAESEIWKKFFPAAVESCRRYWSHGPSCEYVSAGHIPLSVEDWESPICRCGEGKDTASFPKISSVACFKEVATRIAIPMLSAVSYVESMNPRAIVNMED